MIRNPAVAGQFYPASKEALEREVRSLVDPDADKEDAIGVVSPHAGYAYSGAVAGSVLSAIKPRKRYVMLGPNHTGLGSAFAIDESGSWKTPLGEVEVDRELADEIRKNCEYITSDSVSHAYEHSIEVQLPLLQFLQYDFKIVPIVISYADSNMYRVAGKAIARAIKNLRAADEVTIIASSDMTHYEPQEEAKKKDSVAIRAMLELDEVKLIRKVSELGITMCGYAPVAVMITAAKELGAVSARVVRYQTSGDVTGDRSSVVGYAGIVIN
ncbi:MAG: AmmeMemoRadiSam system protein B [Candidatus Omnitrophota bacterium]